MPSRKRAFLPPLEKGQACITCKVRKVKCDAKAPACTACLRTAAFEGRSADSVQCCYTQVLRKSRKTTESRRSALKKRGTQSLPLLPHSAGLSPGASGGEAGRAHDELDSKLTSDSRTPPIHSQTTGAESTTNRGGEQNQSRPTPNRKMVIGLPTLPPLPPTPAVIAASAAKDAPNVPVTFARHFPVAAATGIAIVPSTASSEALLYPYVIAAKAGQSSTFIADSPRVDIAALPVKPLTSAVNWSGASLPGSAMSLDESDSILTFLETELSMTSPTFDTSSSFGSPQSTFWSDFTADDSSQWSCTPSPPPFADCSTISLSEPPFLMDLALPLDHQSLAQWFPLPPTPSLELGLRERVW
ncbi:BQ2448_6510 [Microbotryum intermedium]|uniref:BQ2448_6510 protein n=1 Tax=Microbotryum intermedium TaxID=269621 RepID=A0A238FS68_9BASI|nr:BQ2448_6510 [Microbotryum intermedium]